MYGNGFTIIKWLIYGNVIVLLSACGGTSNIIDIDAKDDVTFPTLETSITINKEKDVSINIRASTSNGKFHQYIPDGKVIVIDGTDIFGPGRVNGDIDLKTLSVGLGSEHLLESHSHKRLDIVGYFGMFSTDMDFSLTDGFSNYRVMDNTKGIFAKLGFSYLFTPSLKATASLSGSVALADIITSSESEIRLDYQLIKHLNVMGGFRWLNLTHSDESDSYINMNFRGPFFGLYVPF